jgi:hypothetical protein
MRSIVSSSAADASELNAPPAIGNSHRAACGIWAAAHELAEVITGCQPQRALAAQRC